MSEFAIGFGDVPLRLAEAVGLPSNNLVNFTIEVRAGEVITVRSDHHTTTDAVNAVSAVFEDIRAEGVVPKVTAPHVIPPNRIEDLRLRSTAGTLTSGERLALAVLAGGPKGEESLDKLIDEAMEEYGRGGYRVPVRVVADKSKLLLIVCPPAGANLSQRGYAMLRDQLREWLEGPQQACVLPAGFTVLAFECENGPRVEIREATEEAA